MKGRVFMKKAKKNRVSGELLAIYAVIGLFLFYFLFNAFFNIDRNITDYQRMVEEGAERRRNSVVLPKDSSVIDYPMPTYEQPLTPPQLILKDAGISIDTPVNWPMIEGIACLTEHEVGFDAAYFEGYDFDEIQQTMAASVINRMRSEDFPYGFSQIVNQDGQYPGMWEYICKHHKNVKRETIVNVLKVYYHKSDYSIPKDIFFEHSFPYDESLEEATDIGEVTPAVGNSCQAAEWLAEQGVSTGLYSYSSYIYDEGNGVKRLLLFSGSSTGPY